MSEPKSYLTIQIILHWTIAALVIFQLVVNEDMQRAFAERVADGDMDIAGFALVHMAVGITVLVLAVLRLGIRLNRGVPPPHGDAIAVIVWLGQATHLLLYGFIFFMPLTGAIAWFFGIELSAVLHEIGRLILVPAIGFHIVGALAEHFVYRNDTLKRMLWSSGD